MRKTLTNANESVAVVENGDPLDKIIVLSTVINYLFILYPIFLVKNLKNISIDVIIPNYQKEFKTLYSPLISFTLFMVAHILFHIHFLPHLISIGGVTYGIISEIYVSAVFVSMMDA